MTPAEKKAAYAAKQRERENARRAALGIPAYDPTPAPRKRKQSTPRPRYGSQQWAETYRDDLGESFD